VTTGAIQVGIDRFASSRHQSRAHEIVMFRTTWGKVEWRIKKEKVNAESNKGKEKNLWGAGKNKKNTEYLISYNCCKCNL
jgi:hypothetical protein